MNFWKRRKLRKHIKSINFPMFLKNYGDTGEYKALCWLKAYVEQRTSAEPQEVIKSMVMALPDLSDRLYIWTLLEWM